MDLCWATILYIIYFDIVERSILTNTVYYEKSISDAQISYEYLGIAGNFIFSWIKQINWSLIEIQKPAIPKYSCILLSETVFSVPGAKNFF